MGILEDKKQNREVVHKTNTQTLFFYIDMHKYILYN
jgi:hypothetical protein